MTAARKIAITIHEHTLVYVDAEARRLNVSRSHFIREAVEARIKALREQEIIDQLNEAYGDPEYAAEMVQLAEELLAASAIHDEPNEW